MLDHVFPTNIDCEDVVQLHPEQSDYSLYPMSGGKNVFLKREAYPFLLKVYPVK